MYPKGMPIVKKGDEQFISELIFFRTQAKSTFLQHSLNLTRIKLFFATLIAYWSYDTLYKMGLFDSLLDSFLTAWNGFPPQF